MKIYPAIDIKNGECVRLTRGEMDTAVVYGQPAQKAALWETAGAKRLHVVDLDAAFAGRFSNREAVKAILAGVRIPIQLGGGVRTMEDIEERLEIGVWRVILGTVALKNPALVRQAAKEFPGRIVVGIDAKGGNVAVAGWADESQVPAKELALKMRDVGIQTIIYTDIARDGMLSGPNVQATEELVKATGMEVIASGGISTISDLRKVKAAGATGAIIGKALYQGNLTLEDALKEEEEC